MIKAAYCHLNLIHFLWTVSAPQYFQQTLQQNTFWKKLLYRLYLPSEQASRPLSWIKVCHPCEWTPHCVSLWEVHRVKTSESKRQQTRERQRETEWETCDWADVVNESFRENDKWDQQQCGDVVLPQWHRESTAACLAKSLLSGWLTPHFHTGAHKHSHSCTGRSLSSSPSPYGWVQTPCRGSLCCLYLQSHSLCCYPELMTTDPQWSCIQLIHSLKSHHCLIFIIKYSFKVQKVGLLESFSVRLIMTVSVTVTLKRLHRTNLLY